MKKEYFRKMTKRACAALPVIFLSMAVMLVIVFVCMTAFRVNGRVRVGVAMKGEDKMMSALLYYIENTGELSSQCEFVSMDEGEGTAQLEKGDISALLVIPEKVLERIYQNRETRIQVYMPKTPTLESGLIRELSESGASMVLSAKAGDFTAFQMYQKYGIKGSLHQVSNDMNGRYIRFAMRQESLFANAGIDSEDGMSDGDRLMSSGIACLLLLLGVPMAVMLRKTPEALKKQLARKGLSASFCHMGKLVPAVVILYLTGVCSLIAVHVYLGLETSLFPAVLVLLPMCYMLAEFFALAYEAGGTGTGTAVFLFLAAVVLVFLPGGIFPPYLLPDELVKIGSVLPGGCMIRTVFFGLWKERACWDILAFPAYGVFFRLLGMWTERRGGKSVC